MKRFAPAAERNQAAILAQLQRILRAPGRVLEIASGTGQHALFFAHRLPHLKWQPSDLDPDNLRSIAAYRAETGGPNLMPPIAIDVRRQGWPATLSDTAALSDSTALSDSATLSDSANLTDSATLNDSAKLGNSATLTRKPDSTAATPMPWQAIVCINMIHIAPWEASIGLFEGAASLLEHGKHLLLYGPFRFNGQFTAPSNLAFDERLRAEDPSYGVRDIRDLQSLAQRTGFALRETIDMPANNHVLVFQKT